MKSPIASELLFRKTQNTALQFIRYIFVGGFAALIDTGSLYVLYAYLGINHLLAAAVGFVFGLLANYLISIVWVFESTGNVGEEFALFAMIGLGGLAWTELIMWVSVDIAHLPVMAGKLIALILVLIWNFGMRKKLVFGSK